MDKAEYIARAPSYYALAICVVLNGAPGPMTEYKIRSRYPRDEEPGEPEPGNLLDRHPLWEHAVRWLQKRELILVKYDAFGPPIYFKDREFDDKFRSFTEDQSLPFAAWREAGENDDWLRPALYSVDNAYDNLGMTPADFEDPDAEWKPLPIDKKDPTVAAAIESLQKVIDEVRADNDYTAHLPQERDYVLEGLQSAVTKLEAEAISPGYVRMCFERFGTLARRFTGTVREESIAVAKAALP